MRRIIYSSQATHDVTLQELTGLLSLSRELNQRVGLTGMLLYSSQSFLQLLEGESQAVAETYARIVADGRHRNLRLLVDAEVAAPLFLDWSMGFDHGDDEDLAEELNGYTPATLYPLVNPDLISNGTVAEALLTLYAKNRAR